MPSEHVAGDHGLALVDLLMATMVMLSAAALAVPLTSNIVEAHEGHAAASYLASRIREVRLRAVTNVRATALVFDREGTAWTLRRCSDGNGNGVRRVELENGPDECLAPQRLEWLFGGVQLGLDPAVPGIDEPAGGTEGVRFGQSAMASCSPAGHCTPGTLYVRSAARQFAVRVAGITGRTRLFRFDDGQRRWEPQ